MKHPHDTWREFSGVAVALAVLGGVAAVVIGIYLGSWVAGLVTIGLALVLIASLAFWSVRRDDPSTRDAPHVPPPDDGRHRVLLVADTGLPSADLVEAVRSHARGRAVSVFVTAPALATRLGRLASDQHAYDDATRRLEDLLTALRQVGLPAAGEVGADDPLQATDDGLRKFRAGEIVFVTHEDRRTGWLEDHVVETARSRYEQPVEHIAVA